MSFGKYVQCFNKTLQEHSQDYIDLVTIDNKKLLKTVLDTRLSHTGQIGNNSIHQAKNAQVSLFLLTSSKKTSCQNLL